jgi:hypothetical protein
VAAFSLGGAGSPVAQRDSISLVFTVAPARRRSDHRRFMPRWLCHRNIFRPINRAPTSHFWISYVWNSWRYRRKGLYAFPVGRPENA